MRTLMASALMCEGVKERPTHRRAPAAGPGQPMSLPPHAWSSILLPWSNNVPFRREHIYQTRQEEVGFTSRIAHRSQKVEATQMSISRMDQHNAVYTCNGLLFSLKRKEILSCVILIFNATSIKQKESNFKWFWAQSRSCTWDTMVLVKLSLQEPIFPYIKVPSYLSISYKWLK